MVFYYYWGLKYLCTFLLPKFIILQPTLLLNLSSRMLFIGLSDWNYLSEMIDCLSADVSTSIEQRQETIEDCDDVTEVYVGTGRSGGMTVGGGVETGPMDTPTGGWGRTCGWGRTLGIGLEQGCIFDMVQICQVPLPRLSCVYHTILDPHSLTKELWLSVYSKVNKRPLYQALPACLGLSI